jgi:hypothetical protein
LGGAVDAVYIGEATFVQADGIRIGRDAMLALGARQIDTRTGRQLLTDELRADTYSRLEIYFHAARSGFGSNGFQSSQEPAK